jgi:hypothetical protein
MGGAGAVAAQMASTAALQTSPRTGGGGGGGIENASMASKGGISEAQQRRMLASVGTSRLGQTITMTPEQFQAEIAKLKSRVSELKKELDDSHNKATAEQSWLLRQVKEAQEKSTKAQAEAAEAIRAAKDKVVKATDEHARQVQVLLDNSNRVVSEQERLAASTPRHAIPSLLRQAGIDFHLGPAPADGGASARPGTARPGTARPGTAPVSLPTLGAADHAFGATAMDFEALRREYAEALARLRTSHEAEVQRLRGAPAPLQRSPFSRAAAADSAADSGADSTAAGRLK